VVITISDNFDYVISISSDIYEEVDYRIHEVFIIALPYPAISDVKILSFEISIIPGPCPYESTDYLVFVNPINKAPISGPETLYFDIFSIFSRNLVVVGVIGIIGLIDVNDRNCFQLSY
jgi:hypothetical protein